MRDPILVLGKYEIISPIASGGMATVYHARVAGPMGFEKPVAVKVLLDDAAQSEEIIRMFIDEARLGARLSHPDIASVLDFGEVSGRYFMAMEYVDGFSLANLRKRLAGRKAMKPLDTWISVTIARRVLHALAYAHDLKNDDGSPLSIVHRDVSPQNILLDRSGNVKLCDFGIATGSYRIEETRSGMVKGKAGYMSPEQAAGRKVDARSDLYSLALTLFTMLSGESPIRGADSGEIRSASAKGIGQGRIGKLDCPDELKDVLSKALEKKPKNRFKNAEDFLSALIDAYPDPTGEGRKALVKLLRRFPRDAKRGIGKDKKADAARKAPRRRSADSGDVKAVRNLLLVVGGIALLALILAYLGVDI